MAGLFFCLVSVEGAGLLFCSAAIRPHTSVYSAFCAVRAIIQHTLQNSAQGFTGDFPVISPFYRRKHQTYTSGYNTACATLERLTAPQHLQCILRYQRHAGRCTVQYRPPIIIRYIRVQEGYAPVMDPRQTVQQIAGRASPAGSRCFPRPAACNLAPVSSHGAPAGTLHPAGQSSSRGAAGGAEPLTATAASLFGLSPDS
jgi:hypothetical protein